MNYILTDIEKHNLETVVLNATNQIMHLETLLEKHTGNPALQGTTEIMLNQLQNAQRTLDNLMPVHEVIEKEWKDEELDVHKS